VLGARRTSAVAALALVTAMLCAIAPIPTFAADPPPIVVSPGDGDSSGVGIGVHDPGARGDDGSQGKPSGSNACDFPEGAPVPSGCEAVEQARYCAGLETAAAQVGGYDLANMPPGQLAALNTTLVGVGCPQWNGGGRPPAAEGGAGAEPRWGRCSRCTQRRPAGPGGERRSSVSWCSPS